MKKNLGEVIRTLDLAGKKLLSLQLDSHIQDSTRSILHDLASNQTTSLGKTRSTTTILPSQFEASIRTVDGPTAHAWASTYLSASYWKEAGFDYIPVEPYLFRPLKMGLSKCNNSKSPWQIA